MQFSRETAFFNRQIALCPFAEWFLEGKSLGSRRGAEHAEAARGLSSLRCNTSESLIIARIFYHGFHGFHG